MSRPERTDTTPTPAARTRGVGSGERSTRTARRARRTMAALASGAVAALVLSGCSLLPGAASDQEHSSSSSASASASGSAQASPAAIPQELKSFYEQDLKWKNCSGGQCADLTVPLDYAHPGGATISIAVLRTGSSDQDKPALFVNPGGPGGSGIEFVRQSAQLSLSTKLRSAYDVVGFDPRGVGSSTAVTCLSDAQQDREREEAVLPEGASGIKQLVQDAKDFGAACEKNSKAGLLQHVDSVSAAKDLDILRAAMHQDTLNYLGYSYGTKLGSLYVQQFPARAGRMVLDGALDPSLDVEQVATGQAEAFEHSLDTYLKECLSSNGCPLSGGVTQARKQLTDFLDATNRTPLPSNSGRKVPAADVVSALLLPLYEPTLSSALTSALRSGMEGGDGTALLALADASAERNDDGSYANNTDAAFNAINCVDYPHLSGSTSAIEARAAALKAKAPLFGWLMGYDDGCSTWPAKDVVKPAKLSVPDTVAPLLVVGTTQDPATPYAWAQSLSKQLPGSHLLTYEGGGHTAYGRSNECIVSAVDGYLVDGKLPAEGTRC